MIVTCDSCQTRYLVADTLLAPDGRRVRCSVCEHEWYVDAPKEENTEFQTFQEYVEEVEQVDEFDPIPDSIKPLADEVSPALLFELDHMKRAKIISMFAAMFIGVCLFGIILFMQEPITRSWPPMIALYDSLDIPTEIKGEMLQLSELKAITGPNKEGVNSLHIEGNIINLRNKDVMVPDLQAHLRLDGGEVIDSWIIQPSHPTISKQGTLSFSTVYPDISKDVNEVNIHFVLTP